MGVSNQSNSERKRWQENSSSTKEKSNLFRPLRRANMNMSDRKIGG